MFTCLRYKLDRETVQINTPYEDVNIKISKNSNIKKIKIEFDDVEKLAKLKDISFEESLKFLNEYSRKI